MDKSPHPAHEDLHGAPIAPGHGQNRLAQLEGVGRRRPRGLLRLSVEEVRVVPHEEVRGLERLTGPREATVETAEPGRRPHPVLEPEAAELDPIHELEEEPEAPAGLVPDGAVVLRRPQRPCASPCHGGDCWPRPPRRPVLAMTGCRA